MVRENFQIYGVEITGKSICESKNWIYSFLVILSYKTLSQFFIITPRQNEITYFQQTAIFESLFSCQQNLDSSVLQCEGSLT